MNPNEILAIVVSFNGTNKLDATVRALVGQVGHIHVVDNGSAEPTLAYLESLELLPEVSMTRLPENCGVGHALNLGVAWARDHGFTWLLTMDQDSLADKHMVEAYCLAVRENPERVCLAPVLFVHGDLIKSAHDGIVEYAITSGNLVRVDLFEIIGPYNEAMFIDAVDFDFCLRVRNSGQDIWRVAGAILHHELGEPHLVPWPIARFYTLHSPTRRYYMYRNFFYLAEQHVQKFPIFIIKSAIAHFILLLLIPFFDRQPWESLAAVWQGIQDYFSCRMGERKGRPAEPSPNKHPL